MSAPFTLNLPSLAAQTVAGPSPTASQGVSESTLAVPFWRRFTTHLGDAGKATLAASASLAALIARMVRAIVERIASAFGLRAGPEQPGAVGEVAGAGEAAQGNSLNLVGPTDGIANASVAIDSALEDSAKYMSSLLARMPQAADLSNDAGSVYLVEALSHLGKGLKGKEVERTEQLGTVTSLAHAYASHINAGAAPGTPALSAEHVLDLLRSPVLPGMTEKASLVALRAEHGKLQAIEQELEKIKAHFVLHCQTAKSLGEDSSAYYVARRYVSQFADDQMQAQIDAPLPTVNNFAETSTKKVDLPENTLQNTPPVVDSQPELKLVKTDNAVKSSRSARFVLPKEDIEEISRAGIERQR